MKLNEHVDQIRSLIHKSFNNQFARLGVAASKREELSNIPEKLHNKRKKIDQLIETHLRETGNYADAREKALDELTFTLFNRLAALKVMEARQLFPPVVTKEAEHGDRSFGHKVWLEEHPEMLNEELEGIREYLKYEFNKLGESIPLYHKDYPYALLPYVIDLNEIIDAFNAVELDPQIDDNIWESDDILGWLYESYNNAKKQAHKDSGEKTEYHKVSLQSQVYTPRWVVEFLVNNSLGKLYLEMYPDSEIKEKYKIANVPEKRTREPRPLHKIRLIDPAAGSGNFLLYAFELFYALYEDQIDNFGADYDEEDIARLIIENNLHGIDLDDRAIQLAQLGLWIKAKKKQHSIGQLKFKVVSSDFILPDYEEVKHIFETGKNLNVQQKNIIRDIWSDLQQAHKFGSLIRIEEKLSIKLHGLLDKENENQVRLFDKEILKDYESFKESFFSNLQTAVASYARQQGNSFLTDKTRDAITYLKLLTQKYYIATTNPPFTDRRNFGPELKYFVETNYKRPYKFHTNLYATFIKRCFELTNKIGKLAMIHPLTFMFLKTFEDVRKYILNYGRINIMVYHGPDTKNIFDGAFASAPAYYVIDKSQNTTNSLFINVDEYTRTNMEKYKKEYVIKSLEDHLKSINNKHVFQLNQNEFREIKSSPFIFWISRSFRKKFNEKSIDEVMNVRQGIATGNNDKCIRFWWEVEKTSISRKLNDGKKWVGYSKGGPSQKWYGNLWLVINFSTEGYEYLLNHGNNLPSRAFYFKKGITYTFSGLPSFRILPENHVFDVSGSSMFKNKFEDDTYTIAFLNSKISNYILKCLNPTTSTQVGDLKRIPFTIPSKIHKDFISKLSKTNIDITLKLKSYQIIENNFIKSPILIFTHYDLKSSIKRFISYETILHVQVLINEAIINEKIFEVYELTEADRQMVIEKEGESIGSLPVCHEAKAAYLNEEEATKEFPLDNIREYIENLPEKAFSPAEREAIENEFPQLYQSNNNLEEFCIRHGVNPINVWYWFKQSNVIPQQRMHTLAMEFLADMIREILMEDEDGIIPLVPNAGETVLLDRIEEKFIQKGFSMAQYSSFDSLLGRELNEYINNYFFKELSDHLNLFMYLPKTPFIWHLTSGPEQGFDAYIIIYKWNRDKLLRIRSVYIENRERALRNRQSDLVNDNSAKAQNEKDRIYKQLKEIESFKQKIDELLQEGYNPVLDDGVGKNIAPLQNKGMLAYEVLNKGQLKKYLNADW